MILCSGGDERDDDAASAVSDCICSHGVTSMDEIQNTKNVTSLMIWHAMLGHWYENFCEDEKDDNFSN